MVSNNRHAQQLTRRLLTLADFSDRYAKLFPGRSHVPVFGARDANAHRDIRVDQFAKHKSFANRLLKKLADNRHTLPNANSVISEFTLSLSAAMLGRRGAKTRWSIL